MTVPALALTPVLVDGAHRASAPTLDQQLLDRASKPDYHQWLAGAAAAGGCRRPIRLRGTIRDVDPVTGDVLRTVNTVELPDRAIYTPCGDRRASVCPACAERYRRDAYQLIRAGITGGKGVPDSIQRHPAVFATFTAPSFGLVHVRVVQADGRARRCQPRRHADVCPHGRRLSCGQRHPEVDRRLGAPLCPDCWDYTAAVVWNAHAPELWRRTTIGLRRCLARHARQHDLGQIQLSYAKVAEFQARGLVHFHAVFRLDAVDQAGQLVPPGVGAEDLVAALRDAVRTTWFATVAHPARPAGWDIAWGRQFDARIIELPSRAADRNIAVAAYLAKYSTKSTEPVGTVSDRITTANVAYYGNPRSHKGRLILAAWRTGSHSHPDFAALRRWAHMLGYRGHFTTKSRRYSTTLKALRAVRANYRRRQHRDNSNKRSDRGVITVISLRWAGRGWRTTGDAVLALSAAARARDHQRASRDEARVA
jgi:hypothetical protein